MDRLIIESLLIFVITYLLFELLNKYIEVDRIIILILSVVISAIYYMRRFGYEHLENISGNSNNSIPDNSNPEEKPIDSNEKTKDLTIEQTGDKTEPNKLDIKDQKIEVNGDIKVEQTNTIDNKENINNKEVNENTDKNEVKETNKQNEIQPNTILKQANEADFKVNNENNDGTLNYFSDKNIQKIKKGKAYDDTFTDHVESNIDKQNTRNQFQTDDNDFNVNGHSNIPDKLEDVSIEGLKDPDVITNENQYTQYGGYIDANSLYVPRDYQYTDDDYGWNFIPPLKWIDLPDQNAPRVPLCVSANGNCRVNASLTIGYPITVKTWNESRKVMGPSHIDVNYIKNHLNTVKPPEEIKS